MAEAWPVVRGQQGTRSPHNMATVDLGGELEDEAGAPFT